MNIIQPSKEYIPAIMGLFEDCTEYMKSQGINQWGDFYPTREIIETDIQTKTLYAIVDKSQGAPQLALGFARRQEPFPDGNNILLGVINISENQEEQYKSIKWSDNSDKILVIHRLAVHPDYQKQGIARQLMDFAENYGKQYRYSSVRLDAYSINKRVLRFYENRGYIKRGEVFFPYRNAPFYCYEKIL